MTDLEALKNNITILNNINMLLQRAPHVHGERPAVDQALNFIQGLLEQSKKIEVELASKEQPIEPKQVEEVKQEVNS